MDEPIEITGGEVREPVPEVPAPKKKKKAKRRPRGKGQGKLLLIVESPAKAKTINKFVGSRYVVKACMGHVRDLPHHRLGVDVKNNFAPQYVTVRGKGDVMKELKRYAAKSDAVYLATDPDREGEAIGWHLKEALKLPAEKVRRVVFNEITKKVVKEAVDQASPVLNMKLVEAQQARRVLDRLMGYSLSPLLWTKVRKGLSAGRVQSVAVRMICEREAEVKAFIPQEYWTIEAKLDQDGSRPFQARLTHLEGEKVQMVNAAQAQGAVDRLSGVKYLIGRVERKEQKRNPAPPFITSTMQQEAAKRYRYTAKRTMAIAQMLYEGMDLGEGGREGLITYMRTDSVRVGADAQQEARKVLAEIYGAEILPPEPPVYKGRASAQDAHEAIRPSSAARDPESIRNFLTEDQYKLYRLIWQRFMASQSAPALLEQTMVEISAGPGILRANGSVVKSPGFMSLYKEIREEGEEEPEEEKEGTLPAGLAEGMELNFQGLAQNQHFTQPPPRYSDASLVKALEEKGIGRPSTYAPIISTVLDRGYVERREGRFHPTELGTLVNELLVAHFQDVINVEFTAKMEESLDRIGEGEIAWTDVLHAFHEPFAADMEKAKVEMRNVKKEVETVTDVVCEKCGKQMMVRWGRHGKFLACSGYPECKNAKSFKEDADGKISVREPEITDEKCEKCGSFMVKRSGRFGDFLACQRYPECKTSRPVPTNFKCPKPGCEGKLVPRRSRRGRVFFGCNKYPNCNFVSWDRPIEEPCPKCGSPFVTEKRLKAVRRLACPVEGCGWEKEEPLTGAAPAAESTDAGTIVPLNKN